LDGNWYITDAQITAEYGLNLEESHQTACGPLHKQQHLRVD